MEGAQKRRSGPPRRRQDPEDDGTRVDPGVGFDGAEPHLYYPSPSVYLMTCPNCDAAAYTDLGLNLGDITASLGDSPEAIPDSETLVRCDECGVLYDTGIAGT